MNPDSWDSSAPNPGFTNPWGLNGIREWLPGGTHGPDHNTVMQLIDHLNKSAGSDTIVIDEVDGLILDAAILNPRKRREMAIGPERTKAFMTWVKAQKANLN